MATRQKSKDAASVNASLNERKPMNFAALQRLVINDLYHSGSINEGRICGYTRDEVRALAEHPSGRSKDIIRLSTYMYLKSGYYRRLVDYSAYMPKCNWTLDVSATNPSFYKVKADTLRAHFMRCAGFIDEMHLETEFPEIMKRVFMYDACFGYVVRDTDDVFIHYLDPDCCEIVGRYNGTLMFAINTDSIKNADLKKLPPELVEQIKAARVSDVKNLGSRLVVIPPENSFCVKYNDMFTYLYPPLFDIISNILDIDDYKALKKTAANQEVYRLIVMKIPVDGDKQIALGDDVIVPFVQMAKGIVPKSFGLIPSPMEVEPIEFDADSSAAENLDKSVGQLYDEAGVSPQVMAGATTNGALSTSIVNDSGDLFRLYRQIERLMNLHLKIHGMSLFRSYTLMFTLLDMTIFNESDVRANLAKAVQFGSPTKMRWLAGEGINPARMFGNEQVERLLEIGKNWTVLQTSATQSVNSGSDNGRPQKDDDSLSDSGEAARENGTNDAENRG